MSNNRLRFALRFLARHKGYTGINILGLTLGLCACLVIYNIVSYEFSFDRSAPDGDRIGNASWTEVFNSDSEAYGGWNIGNAGATLHGSNGALNVVLPAAGLVVFRRSDLNTNGLRS